MIKFTNVSHIYSENLPFEFKALENINFEILEKKVYAIIGHTGSGKSTLIQHINGLLLPTTGEVQINDQKTTDKYIKKIRKNIGMVFQFPEHQLFEETVLKDIIFGPMNFGFTKEESINKARQAIVDVGMSLEDLEKSPFDLSGGQQRRVAIAGILAIDPQTIILDEPTAGLDPKGAKDILNLFKKIQDEQNKTIILITHYMDDVLEYADEVIIMNNQKLVGKYNTEDLFWDKQEILKDNDLGIPKIVEIQMILNKELKLNLREKNIKGVLNKL